MSKILDGKRLTLKEAAELCGVHVNTIHRWRRVGHRGRKLRLIRLGGRTFVREADLEEFAAALSDPPAAETARERDERSRRAVAYLESQGL